MSYEKAVEAAEFIKSKATVDARTAIVLGSVTTKVLTHIKIPVLVCH